MYYVTYFLVGPIASVTVASISGPIYRDQGHYVCLQ